MWTIRIFNKNSILNTSQRVFQTCLEHISHTLTWFTVFNVTSWVVDIVDQIKQTHN